MKNITHISAARRNLAAPKPDENALDEFLISFDDVFCYAPEGSDTNLPPQMDDTIELGARAAVQVKHIFWRFGLRQIPETYGELMGNWAYCVSVACWLLRFDDAQSAEMQQLAFERHEGYCPGRGQMLRNLAKGDLDAVWNWHRETGTFEKNGIDKIFTKG